MEAEAGSEAGRAQKTKDTRAAYLVPNKVFINAYERALYAGLGLEFASFVPSRPCRALKAHEERYYVAHADLGSDVPLHPDDPMLRRRSCIYDPHTEERWVEVK